MRGGEIIAELGSGGTLEGCRSLGPAPTRKDRIELCPDLLREVLVEPGFPLDGSVRSRMEKAFSTDFTQVVIHDSPHSHELARRARVKALTIGRHICFASSAYDTSSTFGRLTLAHELAHIVQKSLGKHRAKQSIPCLNSWSLEAEAVLASLCVVWRGASPALSPDPADEAPRAWGMEGHYFTVLLIALLAGLPTEDALALAFYAQLPDQINDLDAIVAGKSWFETVVVRTVLPVTGPLITRPPQPHLNVQAALHCLNGNTAVAETKFRSDVLDKQSFKATFRFEYGLALHAFGDSFAHRDSDSDTARMFTYPYGHLVKYPQNFHAEDLMGLGESIDNINRRSKLYKEYGMDMYRLFLRQIGKAAPPIPFPAVDKILADISSKPTGTAQLDSIRGQIRSTSGSLDSYVPEENPMTWDQFKSLHPKYITPDMKDRAMRWIARMSLQSM